MRKLRWCLAKRSILAILKIIMKELGIVDFRHCKPLNLPASIRDTLLGWKEPTLGPSFDTLNAISSDIYAAK